MMSILPWTEPEIHLAVIIAALSWDRWIGEPPMRFHPVVWMGNAIGWMRKIAPLSKPGAFLWGMIMAIVLPFLSSLLGFLTLLPWIGPFIAIWLMTSSFALRGLVEAGENVATALERKDIEFARSKLGWLCSRDPKKLDENGISAAATESVAENSSDSLIAPLMWYAVAGVPGALAYRCINTLDAMIGYRDRYEWLGKSSARLDDLVNIVPARLSAVLLLVVSLVTPKTSIKRGVQILFRDRNLTSSPNAGWPMSCIAGLVGAELFKPNHYSLGKGLSPCTASHLRIGCALADRAMLLFACILIISLAATWLLPILF
ncbi:MAG: adenosylcobinamide-phosphate synthase CbiB [Myxococcota bacterium]